MTSKRAKRVPGDIDFVTGSNDKAIQFITEIISLYEKYNWYGNIQIQNKTSFCFSGTLQHYKIKNSFGVNVCIMVLKDNVNFWYNEVGICIQKINDVVSFMNIAKEKDGKTRIELETT